MLSYPSHLLTINTIHKRSRIYRENIISISLSFQRVGWISDIILKEKSWWVSFLFSSKSLHEHSMKGGIKQLAHQWEICIALAQLWILACITHRITEWCAVGYGYRVSGGLQEGAWVLLSAQAPSQLPAVRNDSLVSVCEWMPEFHWMHSLKDSNYLKTSHCSSSLRSFWIE